MSRSHSYNSFLFRQIPCSTLRNVIRPLGLTIRATFWLFSEAFTAAMLWLSTLTQLYQPAINRPSILNVLSLVHKPCKASVLKPCKVSVSSSRNQKPFLSSNKGSRTETDSYSDINSVRKSQSQQRSQHQATLSLSLSLLSLSVLQLPSFS